MRHLTLILILILGALFSGANESDSLLFLAKKATSEDAIYIIHTHFSGNEPKELPTSVNLELARLYLDIGSTEMSLFHGIIALESSKELSNDSLMIESEIVIGDAYRRIRNFEYSLEHFDEALRLSKSKPTRMPMILNSRGVILAQLNRFEDSKQSLLYGLELATASSDSAGMARILTNLGFIHNRNERYDLALKYYQMSLEIKQGLGNKSSLAYTLNDMGEVYSFIGEFEQSISLSRKALILATEAKAIYYMRDINRTLSRTYEKINRNDSALFFLSQYQVLQDSIVNEDRATEIARLERIQEIKEAELQNSRLKAENIEKNAEIEKRNAWLYMSALLLVVLLISGIILYNIDANRQQLVIEIEAKNLELELRNKELTKSLNEQESLFNIVTHDIRGPLANVTQLLALEEEETDFAVRAEMRQLVTQSAKSALEFINDFDTILSFDRKKQLPPSSTFDLVDVLNSIIHDFKTEIDRKKLEIHLDRSAVQKISNVKGYVKHILYNILSNAIKYSPENGSIFISIIVQDSVRISIEDHGPGIPPESIDRIFERFYRGSDVESSSGYKSSGLGLAIVKLLVTRLDGEIKVRSEVGLGSEFIVSLPK